MASGKRDWSCALIQTHSAHSLSLFSSAISWQTLQTCLIFRLSRKLSRTVGTTVPPSEKVADERPPFNPNAVSQWFEESTAYTGNRLDMSRQSGQSERSSSGRVLRVTRLVGPLVGHPVPAIRMQLFDSSDRWPPASGLPLQPETRRHHWPARPSSSGNGDGHTVRHRRR